MRAKESRENSFGGKDSTVRVQGLWQFEVAREVGHGRGVAEAVLHEQRTPYVERPDRDTVAIRLRTRALALEQVRLEFLTGPEGKVCRSVTMQPFAAVGDFTYYRAEVGASGGVLRYRFMLEGCGRLIWHAPSGSFWAEPGLGLEHWGSLDVGSLETFATPEWIRDVVFYQIFPDRFANGDPHNDPPNTSPWGGTPTPHTFFGGDFQGIIDKIPYLETLGIGAVWFTPIFESRSNHKYDTADYMRVDAGFGDLDKFKEMVLALHGAGIKVILDGVFNHTGSEFWAFQDIARKGAGSPYADWYYIHSFPVRSHPKPNYEAWWGFADLPKLNMENPEVRQYILDVVTFWMKEVGIDGWRLDVPNEVDHSFWRTFRDHVKAMSPDAYIVGEIWNNGSPWLQGDQFDAVMNYVFRDAVLDFFVHRSISTSEFVARLEQLRADYPAAAGEALLNLLGSHDTERVLSAFGGDTRRMLPAVAFQMSYPGVPMIYYGDEVGMVGHRDPGCRGTMVWDEIRQDRGLLELYRNLIRQRRTRPALRRGTFRWLLKDDPSRTFAFMRVYGEDAAVVAVVAGNAPVDLDLALDGLPAGTGVFRDALTGREFQVSGGRLRIERLGPHGAVLLVSESGSQDDRIPRTGLSTDSENRS